MRKADLTNLPTQSAVLCPCLPLQLAGEIHHLSGMVGDMPGAAQERREAISGVFHAFGGVSRGPVLFRLFLQSGRDGGDGGVKIPEQKFFWVAGGVAEFKRPVADISRPADLRADVVAQIAGKMQQQVSDTVAIRIRAGPYLLVRKRLNQRVNLLRRFLVIAGEIADQSGG
jgi:hypothetical protein